MGNGLDWAMLIQTISGNRLQTWKNLYGKKSEKWRDCMEAWRICREKWRNTYGQSEEFHWKGKTIYMEKNLYGKNMVNWRICMETCRFFIGKSRWKNNEFVCKHEMEKYGKVKNLYRNVKDSFKKRNMEKWWIWLTKWKNLYAKIMEKWRNCMGTRRMFKEKWRISMEKLWIRQLKSERNYMAQRYSMWRQLYSK